MGVYSRVVAVKLEHTKTTRLDKILMMNDTQYEQYEQLNLIVVYNTVVWH